MISAHGSLYCIKQIGMNSDLTPFAANEEETLSLPIDDEAIALSEMYGSLPLQEVEVKTDKAEGRQRQISAKIQIPYTVDKIWQILTDYDHLADFVPNLTQSQCIEHPQGGIRIEQVGAESLLKLKFCARVVLDMVEHFPSRIDFNMVEGDFKVFQGQWLLEPIANGTGTELSYQLLVMPHRLMPIAMIERRLKGGMILNLSAIRQRADVLFGQNG